MKIIFDNDEQKDFILRVLDRVSSACPSDIGYEDADHSRPGCKLDCYECWANCGIEMEVVRDE